MATQAATPASFTVDYRPAGTAEEVQEIAHADAELIGWLRFARINEVQFTHYGRIERVA